jgi:hypothetical protein
VPPDRRTAPVSGSSLYLPCALPLPLAAQWGQPVGAGFFTRALLLSLPRGPILPGAESLTRASAFPLSTPWACPVRSDLPAPTVDQRVRTRACHRVSRPRHPPTRPAPFLEPRPCPALVPRLISHSFALSRIVPSPPDAAGDLRPRSRSSSSPETVPSLPELRPKVRHLYPCPIFHIALCAWPILASPMLGRGGLPFLRGGQPI